MENLDYTSIYKTDNEILDSIKENLIRMLFERNLINKEGGIFSAVPSDFISNQS